MLYVPFPTIGGLGAANGNWLRAPGVAMSEKTSKLFYLDKPLELGNAVAAR
jgi:hypothetical protein